MRVRAMGWWGDKAGWQRQVGGQGGRGDYIVLLSGVLLCVCSMCVMRICCCIPRHPPHISLPPPLSLHTTEGGGGARLVGAGFAVLALAFVVCTSW